MIEDTNKYLCILNEKLPCPFRAEGKTCSGKNEKCGFIKIIEPESTEKKAGTYERKPRWYEKYYENPAIKNRQS